MNRFMNFLLVTLIDTLWWMRSGRSGYNAASSARPSSWPLWSQSDAEGSLGHFNTLRNVAPFLHGHERDRSLFVGVRRKVGQLALLAADLDPRAAVHNKVERYPAGIGHDNHFRCGVDHGDGAGKRFRFHSL